MNSIKIVVSVNHAWDNKKYKLNNRDKILLLKKRYHNSEKGKETDRKYYLEYRKNMPDYVKDKLKASHTKYCRDRYKSDSLYKLMVSMRNLIGLSFRKKKSVKNKKTEEIIGCSIEEFKNFIENKFTDGMSWDNQGIWHLDHIIPISRANDEDELIKLNHYTNFKPMWGIENIKKGNRYDG